MSFHDSIFDPSNQGASSDSEFRAGLCFCQHTALAESVVTWAQAVSFDEIDDAQVSELGVDLIAPRGATGADSLFVQDVRDLGTDMVVEKLVDQFDDLGPRLYLLCGGFRVLGCQRFGPSASEADVDPAGGSTALETIRKISSVPSEIPSKNILPNKWRYARGGAHLFFTGRG